MKTHDEMVSEWLNSPEFKVAYDALEEPFALFDELAETRQRAGLTQEEVAKRMHTKTPAVARLEAGGGNKRHSPSVATLRKYADAVGYHLEIRLVPSSTFWQSKSFDELAMEQGVHPLEDWQQLVGGWPEDADFESFLEAVRSARDTENPG